MGTIDLAYDFDKDLTTVTMSGHLTANELQAWMDEYYTGHPTALVLCDITTANLSELNTNDVRDLADHYRKFVGLRDGSKTALVFDDPYKFGIGRMFESYLEIKGAEPFIGGFKSVDEAKKWLGVKD